MAAWWVQPKIVACAALVLAVALSIPDASAQPPPVPPPPAAATPVHIAAGKLTSGIDVALRPTAVGSISGRVRESGSKRALKSLQVLAFSRSRHIVRRTTTAADGTYTLNALPASGPGYLVCFRAWRRFPDVHGGTSTTGWAPECYRNHVWSGNNATLPVNAARVQVRKGHATRVDATLRPGGAISGRVAQPGGKRGLRADVYVRSVGAPDYRNSVGTDGFGRYRVVGLPPAPGGYQICFEPTPDETVPTAGYVPRCYGTDHWFGFPRQTADSSVGSSPPHWPGAATHVRVGLGKARTGVGARVRRAGAVAGRIVDLANGARLGDPAVHVYDRRGRLIGSEFASEGRFKITGLPPAAADYVCVFPSRYHAQYLGSRADSYQRGCHRDSRWTGSASRTAGAPVRVARGKTHKGVVIALRRASTIQGKLTSARTGRPVLGRVYLFTGDGKFLASDSNDGFDKPGQYVFMGLPASRSGYLVCASAIRRKHLEKPWLRPRCYGGARWDAAGGAPPPAAEHIRIGVDDHARGVDIALHRGGAISGRVTDTSGFHAFRTRLYVIDARNHHVVQTEVAADGTWSVEGLAPGTYRICFADPARHWNFQPTCYPRVRWYRPWAD